MHTPLTPPSIARTLRHPLALLATVACFVAVGACTATDDDTTDTASGCSATVREASLAVEVDEQVVLLDRALVRCRSLDALTTEMRRYPGIVGYEIATFVELRCDTTDDKAVRSSPACSEFAVPATTLVAGPSDPVFVGETLDGRRIEIRPDGDTVFVDGVPEVVQRTVDIAIESGCDGVLAQRALWADRIDEAGFGDEASVYAQHAENVANYIGCEVEPLAG